jgi:hypothetical protein
MTQRDFMKMLYQRHNGNRERVIQEYAAAEEAGLVIRQHNAHGLSPTQYARALFRDGLRRGWLP